MSAATSGSVPAADRVRRLAGTLAWPAAVAGAVWLLFSCTLVYRYGLYDDYNNAGDGPGLLRFGIGDGRPVNGVVQHVLFHRVDRFSEFVWPRAVAVAGIAGCVAALWALLRRAGLPAAGAAALAVCAAAATSTQVIAAWGTTMVMVPVAVLLGGLAGVLLVGATLGPPGTGPAPAGKGRARRLAVGAVALIAAMCIYQPAAMTLWLVAFVVHATRPAGWWPRVRGTLQLGAATAASFAVYTVIWRAGVAATGRGGDRGKLSADPLAKLTWFAESALPRAFRPFSLSPTGSVVLTAVVAAVALAGIIAGLRGPIGDRVLAAVACAGCFPLAYLPNLATAENWASSRSLVVLMPLAVVAVGIGARGWLVALGRVGVLPSWSAELIWSSLLCVAAIGAALRAQSNVLRYLVVSNAAELAAYEDAVRDVAATDPSEILLVPSRFEDTIAPGVSFDEFGFPATAATWALEPMARSAVRGTGFAGTFRVVPRADYETLVRDGAIGPAIGVVDATRVLAAIDH